MTRRIKYGLAGVMIAFITLLAAKHLIVNSFHHNYFTSNLSSQIFAMLWLNAVLAMLPFYSVRQWNRENSFKTLFGDGAIILFALTFYVLNKSFLFKTAGVIRSWYDFFV